MRAVSGSRGQALAARPRSTRRSFAVITKPSRARRTAGSTTVFQGRRPARRCARARPATDARNARGERALGRRGQPGRRRRRLKRSRRAARGAISRKSTVRTRPRASREIQKPPPPRLPASGHVTASAKATATAASAALPPFLRISMPTRAAFSSAAATAPPEPRADLRALRGGGAAARAGARRAAASRRSLRYSTGPMKSIRDLDLQGRRLFLRVDFNVPLEGGAVSGRHADRRDAADRAAGHGARARA